MAFYSHSKATLAWRGIKHDVLWSWWITGWNWLTACPRRWEEERVPRSVPKESHGENAAKQLFRKEQTSRFLRCWWFDSLRAMLASPPVCRGKEGGCLPQLWRDSYTDHQAFPLFRALIVSIMEKKRNAWRGKVADGGLGGSVVYHRGLTTPVGFNVTVVIVLLLSFLRWGL